MKKKLLFAIPSLSAGGGEKSLVTLLSQIDYEKYEVDLFLFNHEGIFMDLLPNEVNVLPLPESYKVFSFPLLRAVSGLFLRRQLQLINQRFLYACKYRGASNVAIREQSNWKYLSNSFENLNKAYDVAIGFLEKSSTYFIVDKVMAKKKIGWVHIDYDHLGMDPDFDIHYFKKLDHIVTVSEECGEILKRRFPSENHKVEVIYNIVSPLLINKMANLVKEDVYQKNKDEIHILSIGRLHPQKGYEIAIDACKKLVDSGINIKWHIIGDGEERGRLTHLIKENRIEDHFKLLGLKSNPYPYIKQADIYAQTSKFEGKSIAIDEAKILQKPILITNYSTAKDQIQDNVEGLIVNMTPQAVMQGILKLIEDHQLRSQFEMNLSQKKLGTESEINKLYQICN
ncbi:glycosyltransferase [Halobacillus sp. BBL2006]|uniref:glycosyltransferase n=1 Tax=Halobacillus sp. BBL2006 TaxID=1543706 RepID=UPI00054196E0|nr:glycosyltransferase [Halobacillus sp. BBL2006]KHE69236.1 glycosyl transferase family 1 [Halobacillus sp. BBL2006]